MNDLNYLLNLAESAAREAGKATMEVFHTRDFEKAVKQYGLPVTKADRDSHMIITAYLEKTGLPVLSEEGSQIEFKERENWQFYWLIDPLDGTEEFIKGIGEFTINIALMHYHKPIGGVIYAPAMDLLYTGSGETGIFKNQQGRTDWIHPLPERPLFSELLKKKTVRVVASRSYMNPETEIFISQFPHATIKNLGSALKFMMLLENQADIYPRLSRTMEWDTAAAHALLNIGNRGLYQEDRKTELVYNKPDLANPSFIAY